MPVPDFISNNRARRKALEMLKQKVELVNKSNAAYICIACNTAHVLLPELQKVSKIPFVSMIDETAKHVYKDGRKKIGLMGTPSTIRYGLYQTALSKYGISVVVPSKKQIMIMENVIRNMLKGKKATGDSASLTKIADDLKTRGAQGIILGCTELPLIFPKKYLLPIYKRSLKTSFERELSNSVYNSLEILAMALLRKYYNKP